ncbi:MULTISPECIES: ABC transporter permease [unclassified Brevibacterium]|uniref:ABC transporter permease n=1 Tax=unclassified Brevibacterium TaxID=2614124 RepID=UPI001865C5BB|nr:MULTISPECIES: ABC transporter permease [unclassified Brevibacterium]
MNSAVRVEALKLVRSLVGRTGTLALVLGVVALLGGITAGIAGGNRQLIEQAGAASTLDWDGLLAEAAQVISVASLLTFGIVLAWMFGREFAEGTIVGLFALPVSRAQISLAKFMVYLLWMSLASLALALSILALGVIVGYGAPSADVWAGLARLWALSALMGCVAAPTAWIATVTRSLLAGVASTIALVVIAQIGALAGAGGWMPLAAPALWAMSNGTGITPVQLVLSICFGAVFVAATAMSWARLQLNR